MNKQLPPPRIQGELPLEAAIRLRRTHREFAGGSLSLSDISRLLWSGQGQTGNSGFRTSPSAGSQYPLRIYLIAASVRDLAMGIHLYLPETHSLELISEADIRESLLAAALGRQPWVGEAAAIIAIAGDFGAANRHFEYQPPQGRRGSRYVYIEAGAAAQNIHLTATELGLGQVLVAGFDDERVTDALGLNDRMDPIALICIGRTRGGRY